MKVLLFSRANPCRSMRSEATRESIRTRVQAVLALSSGATMNLETSP